MSLRFRLAAVVAATFAIVVVGCVFAAHVSASHELRGETDRFLMQRSHDLRIQEGFHGRGSPPGDERPEFAEPDAQVQLIASDGSVNRPSDVPLPVNAEDRAIAAGTGPQQQLRTVHIDETPYRVLTIGVPGGAAQIGRSIKETDDVLSTLDIRLLLIALAGTFVAAVAAWLIARQIVRPIEQLTGAAEDVARTQDLESTITVDRRDELGRLATSFNTMLVALRSSRDQQKRLVMDVSHELRTPLTALRTNMDVLQRTSNLDDAQYAELIRAVQLELGELTELVTELVDLATDAHDEEPVQPIDLGELTERVVERFRRRTRREISFTTNEPATVDIRVGAVERALSNLVDNVCKFSTAPAAIEVRVDGGRIEVADRGRGIPVEDRGHVFDRFYRSPTARTMPGSGLGLSIVKQIVELEGGRVELLPRDGGGTVAQITIPTVTLPT